MAHETENRPTLLSTLPSPGPGVVFMVDIRYFIFILNADTALFTVVVFAMAYVAIRLVYRMWKSSLRCPHCGEPYRGHPMSPPQETNEKALPNKLWT